MLRKCSVDYLTQLVTRPKDTSVGPLCMTCGRVLDREEIVEGEQGRTEYACVLVKHHGAEELHRFDFGSKEWDYRDLQRAMQSTDFFDPNKENGAFAFSS